MNRQKTIQITDIANLMLESKAFLKIVDKIENQRNNFGIIIQLIHGNEKENYTILFKEKKYILIVPKGNKQRAYLYGSCEEALYASKRFLLSNPSVQRELRVSIDQNFS